MGNKTSKEEILSDDELLKRVEEYIDKEYAKVQVHNGKDLRLSIYENKYFKKYLGTFKYYGDLCCKIVLIEKIVKKFNKQFALQVDGIDANFRAVKGVTITFTRPRTAEEVIQFVKEHLEGLNRSMRYLKEHNFLYYENEARMKEVEELLKKAIEQHKIISDPGAPE
jgi:hypothetical protein